MTIVPKIVLPRPPESLGGSARLQAAAALVARHTALLPKSRLSADSITKHKHKKPRKVLQVYSPTLPDRDRYRLKHELSLVRMQIAELHAKQQQLITDIKIIERLAKQDRLMPVSLYSLQLEDGCYYVGMSFNVDKRYKQHTKGKGAAWTKRHKPVRIIEIRRTKLYSFDDAAKLEDDMTLEYALKFGSDVVRGGGWCQTKPVWPDVIVQNEVVAL